MKTFIPEHPPVVTIELHEEDDDAYYDVAVTMDGVKQVFAGEHDYYAVVCLAQGVAYGLELATNVRPVHQFPLTESAFIQGLPEPKRYAQWDRRFGTKLYTLSAALELG